MRLSSSLHGSSAALSGLGAVLLVSLPLACGGPSLAELETGEVAVALTALASAPEVATLAEPAGGLGIARVFVSTSSFSLRPCLDDASPITLGPRGFELLGDPAPGETIATAVRAWCGLRIDIDPVSQNAADGVPPGTSIHIEGSDASATPFALSSSASRSLRFEAEAGTSFGELPLLIGFDVSVWLAGVSLIDGPALPKLDSQIHSAVALYVDENGNRVLDDEEKTPLARAAPAP